MSYRTEELLRLGKREALREELRACKLRMTRLAEEVRMHAFGLEGVESINSAAALQAAEDLHAEQERLGQIKARMAELEG